jgi:hypothetical protein
MLRHRAETVDDLMEDETKKDRARSSIHKPDPLDAEVDRVKRDYLQQKALLDDLEKYRPKNYYKEEDASFDRPTVDVDDYDWESHYQIGPETYLLATRGAAFNARVRDYRREMWGDGAPLVTQGILGYRNSDISVRERRRYEFFVRIYPKLLLGSLLFRYTDIVREDLNVAKSVNSIDSQLKSMHMGAVRRVNVPAADANVPPAAVTKNSDGCMSRWHYSTNNPYFQPMHRFFNHDCAIRYSRTIRRR